MSTAVATPFREFFVTVSRVRRLGTSFTRVTFTGPDLAHFADNGYDQRIKLVFPVPGVGLSALPTGPDWYARWRELPDELRNPIRTYTVRAVRPGVPGADAPELDVDLVRHGDAGPASRWVGTAAPGDELVVIGPDARHPGPQGGVEFRPPAGVRRLLLAGDETAVPAVSAILERLPADAVGEAVLEVPAAEDILGLVAPDGIRITWVARGAASPGSRLVPEVRAAAGRLVDPGAASASLAVAVDEVDVDRQILWEVPADPATGAGAYAWLAGEAGVIRTLRRHLVAERGWDRRTVAFMGYWRLGQSEGAV
jgi:NADPH-dependent ferric siderophore reductase